MCRAWAWPYTLLQNDIFTLDSETGRNDSGYTAHGRDNVKDVYRLYAVSLWMY